MNAMSLFRTKAVTQHHDTSLRRCLGPFDLTLLGIGAIIGAGIFVVTGVAAATKGGPAIILSYIIAGLACSFTALAYAELASSVGGSGSAYGYAYAGLGEFIAWLIGWDLILEYSITVSVVAIGWSGYLNDILTTANIHLPQTLIHAPHAGGIVDLPAVLIVMFITAILLIGVRQTSKFNNAIVFLKLLAVIVFLGIASLHVNPANWHPFMPFGWQGVVEGAALIFFAYIGFDAVSTAAEEAINPQRDLPIGIIASLAVCTLLYIVVAILLTGVASYSTLNVKAPISDVLLSLGEHTAATVIAFGAIAGLTTVILAMAYGLTRILFAMAADGLLPPFFSKVHPKRKTPVNVVLVCGTLTALVAGFGSMDEIVQLVNIGTLAAFIVVCLGTIVLRIKKPDMPRPFKVPFAFLLPILAILCCSYLMLSLSKITWIWFVIWMAIGIIVYFAYSRYHSRLNTTPNRLEG